MPIILLFSGPMASGKTTLADALIAREQFRRLKSSDFLKNLCQKRGSEVSRSALQELGDRLDHETDYRWLVDDVAKPQILAALQQHRWLIDSVRKERQVSHFRKAFASDVYHVHVWVPDAVLKERFDKRRESGSHSEGSTSYVEATSHPNEVSARHLKEIADLCIDLSTVALSTAVASILSLVTRGS